MLDMCNSWVRILQELGLDAPSEEDIDWISDNAAQIDTAEEFYDYKDIVVDVVDRNKSSQDDVKTTTIYYSGYKFPNIHYCVDGQNWTNVPGIQMATNFDVYGFDHVAVIELNGASGVTVCFNDGNNNWDSNNGRNYKFGIGTYYYSNGNIVAE